MEKDMNPKKIMDFRCLIQNNSLYIHQNDVASLLLAMIGNTDNINVSVIVDNAHRILNLGHK
jgi:hypothetical protein